MLGPRKRRYRLSPLLSMARCRPLPRAEGAAQEVRGADPSGGAPAVPGPAQPHLHPDGHHPGQSPRRNPNPNPNPALTLTGSLILDVIRPDLERASDSELSVSGDL